MTDKSPRSMILSPHAVLMLRLHDHPASLPRFDAAAAIRSGTSSSSPGDATTDVTPSVSGAPSPSSVGAGTAGNSLLHGAASALAPGGAEGADTCGIELLEAGALQTTDWDAIVVQIACCWQESPSERPSASALALWLQNSVDRMGA